MKIKLSKTQWEAVGKKAGWMKTALRTLGPTEWDCPQCMKQGHPIKVQKLDGTTMDADCQCPACGSLWKSEKLSGKATPSTQQASPSVPPINVPPMKFQGKNYPH